MRLKQYITERPRFEEKKVELLIEPYYEQNSYRKYIYIVDFLEKNCKQAIKEAKARHCFFWRGLKNPISGSYGVKGVRQNRIPTDTPEEIQKWIDNEFKKKFGWRPRSQAVFAAGSMEGAYNYTTSRDKMMFFPIGSYSYLWSPGIKDLFTNMEDFIMDQKIADDMEKFSLEEITESEEKEIKEHIKNVVNSYTNKKVPTNTHNEIMFNIKSKKYFMVSQTFERVLEKEFKIRLKTI
jgi:hypothetical protein